MELVVPIWPYDRWDSLQSMTRSVRRADELGFHGVFAGDHVLVPPVAAGEDTPEFGDVWPDPLVLGTWYAAHTERIKIIFHVLVLPNRNPFILAKQIATVDALSDGRTVVGVGSGWLRSEFEILGTPFEDRGALTDEHLRVMKELWASERPSHAGDHYNFSDIIFEPKPAQRPHPKLLIAGQSKASVRRVLEHEAGWDPLISDFEEFRVQADEIKAAMVERGQDPDSLEILVGLHVGEGDPLVKGAQDHVGGGGAATVGDEDNLVETTLQELRLYEAAGATQVLTWFPWETPEDHLAQLEWMAEHILPEL